MPPGYKYLAAYRGGPIAATFGVFVVDEGTLIGLAGLAVTILLGFWGARRYRLTQRQKVTRGATGIQSGRDTRIGKR